MEKKVSVAQNSRELPRVLPKKQTLPFEKLVSHLDCLEIAQLDMENILDSV